MNSGYARRLGWLVPLVLAAGASAQGLPDGPAPSVVELSRRARSEESTKGPSAGWVFTNEGRFRQTSQAPKAAAPVSAHDTPRARSVPAPATSPEPASTPADDPTGLVWRLRVGEDRTIVLPGTETFPVTVKLIAGTDRAAIREAQWSQTSGPEPVGLVGSRSSQATVILPAPGAYGLRLTASVGEETAMSEVELVVGSAPSGAEILR